jgi:predicted CoA-binding protein
MPRANLSAIREFLDCKRIAVIGVSRNPRHFSRIMFRELAKRGYDVVPVNPNVEEIEGCRSYPAASRIEPAPEAALLMTPRPESAAAVADCALPGRRHGRGK